MAYTEASKKATMKYIKNSYDEIKTRVPKGHKNIYKQQAKNKGLSLNAYIISLLEQDRTED